MTAGYALIPTCFDPAILDIISPSYPRWTEKCIKRNYGKHPAVYLDVWIPYEKRLVGMIPRKKKPDMTDWDNPPEPELIERLGW